MSDANSLADFDLRAHPPEPDFTEVFGADGTQAWLRYCAGRHALYTQAYRAVDHPEDPLATPIPRDQVDYQDAVCATCVAHGRRSADWERVLLELYNYLTLRALLDRATGEGSDAEVVRVEVQEWRWQSWDQATAVGRDRLRTCVSQDNAPATFSEAVSLIAVGLRIANTQDIDEW